MYDYINLFMLIPVSFASPTMGKVGGGEQPEPKSLHMITNEFGSFSKVYFSGLCEQKVAIFYLFLTNKIHKKIGKALSCYNSSPPILVN